MTSAALFPALLVLAITTCGAAERWELTSPDGSRVISVGLDQEGRPNYTASLNGKELISTSPLGLVLSLGDFSSGLRFRRASDPILRTEDYELFSGPASKIESKLALRSVGMLNGDGKAMLIDLAATNEGVAFRYRFPWSSTDGVQVEREASGFHLPEGTRAWLQPYHAPSPYTPAYEDFFFHVAPGEAPPRSRGTPRGWCFPALFELPGGWALASEVSGLDPFPGSHLAADSSGGVYRVEFAWSDEGRDQPAADPTPDLPSYRLPWTMPWRVLVLAPQAGEIVSSTLLTDLAPPCELEDVSWVRPGRASWAWWSHSNGPYTEALFHHFTDFAADMGWEYTLFDAHWWDPGAAPLLRRAKEKGVRGLLWTHSRDLGIGNQMSRKLDELAGYGAAGVKVDFWSSDRQETLERMRRLFREAAKRKLLVNLHGGTLPRGWHRTWPNFITAEAVLGAESYLFEKRYTEKAAELNTLLPFTRNVAGPMDYTPVALSSARYPRRTTAAHELATALVFSSGLIHLADTPKRYGALPEAARQLLRDLPARWDATRCLLGEPGKLVVLARRSGKTWFLAGINGTDEARPIALDLPGAGNFSKAQLLGEGDDPLEELRVVEMIPPSRWEHTIPARGGFVLRLIP